MSAGKALFGKLSTETAIVAICGTRTYPLGKEPNPTILPAITYDVADTERPTTYGGQYLVAATIDVACTATTPAGARALAAAIETALHGKAGTWGGIEVLGCWVRGDSDEVNEIHAGRDGARFFTDQTVRLWYRPS